MSRIAYFIALSSYFSYLYFSTFSENQIEQSEQAEKEFPPTDSKEQSANKPSFLGFVFQAIGCVLYYVCYFLSKIVFFVLEQISLLIVWVVCKILSIIWYIFDSVTFGMFEATGRFCISIADMIFSLIKYIFLYCGGANESQISFLYKFFAYSVTFLGCCAAIIPISVLLGNIHSSLRPRFAVPGILGLIILALHYNRSPHDDNLIVLPVWIIIMWTLLVLAAKRKQDKNMAKMEEERVQTRRSKMMPETECKEKDESSSEGDEAPFLYRTDSRKVRRKDTHEQVYYDDECAICLGKFRSTEEENELLDGNDGPRTTDANVAIDMNVELRVLFCGHVFHKDCVDHWTERHHMCPTCNQASTTLGTIATALFE